MHYLYLLDGTRYHRSTIVWIGNETVPNVPTGLVGTSGTEATYPVRWTLGPVARQEAIRLAVVIAESYNYQVAIDGEMMDYDDMRLGVRWITSRQAQSIFERATGDTVPISSITNACRRGHIRNATKVGRDWQFRERELWAWLNNRPNPGRPKTQDS